MGSRSYWKQPRVRDGVSVTPRPGSAGQARGGVVVRVGSSTGSQRGPFEPRGKPSVAGSQGRARAARGSEQSCPGRWGLFQSSHGSCDCTGASRRATGGHQSASPWQQQGGAAAQGEVARMGRWPGVGA